MRSLCRGVVVLAEASNTPSARILGRTLFELGAHAYYVKKHVKQHLDSGDLVNAWEFLTPVAAGSRYIAKFVPSNVPFPSSPPISGVINCFSEIMPSSAKERYEGLSEYCHPNAAALMQHTAADDNACVQFAVKVKPASEFRAIYASVTAGLLSMLDLLLLVEETDVSSKIALLLKELAKVPRPELEASGDKPRL